MSYLHDQTLEDFVNHEHSRLAQLMRTHVISLRMHTSVLTAAAPACMAPRLGSSSDPIDPVGPLGCCRLQRWCSFGFRAKLTVSLLFPTNVQVHRLLLPVLQQAASQPVEGTDQWTPPSILAALPIVSWAASAASVGQAQPVLAPRSLGVARPLCLCRCRGRLQTLRAGRLRRRRQAAPCTRLCTLAAPRLRER